MRWHGLLTLKLNTSSLQCNHLHFCTTFRLCPNMENGENAKTLFERCIHKEMYVSCTKFIKAHLLACWGRVLGGWDLPFWRIILHLLRAFRARMTVPPDKWSYEEWITSTVAVHRAVTVMLYKTYWDAIYVYMHWWQLKSSTFKSPYGGAIILRGFISENIPNATHSPLIHGMAPLPDYQSMTLLVPAGERWYT